MQEAFKTLSGGQAVKNVFLLVRVETGLAAHTFQLLLPPALLRLVGEVHVLGTNGTAIGFAQRIEQVTQGHFVLAKKRVAGVKHGFLIGVLETIKGRVKVGNVRALGALQGVKVSPACTDIAVSGNQLLCSRAFATHLGIHAGDHHFGATGLGALRKSINDWLVRHVFGVAAVYRGNVLQGIKIITPGVWHAAWIGQVVFVHLFDVRGVPTKKVGVRLVGLINRVCLTHVSLTFISLGETLAG